MKVLEADFYSSNARIAAPSLADMGAIAIEHFKGKHPELPARIAEVFGWCYTYDYK